MPNNPSQPSVSKEDSDDEQNGSINRHYTARNLAVDTTLSCAVHNYMGDPR
jgi:hypothetical protein